MNVELPYGDRTLTATLPERTRVLSNTEAVVPEPVDDLPAAVRSLTGAGTTASPFENTRVRPGSVAVRVVSP